MHNLPLIIELIMMPCLTEFKVWNKETNKIRKRDQNFQFKKKQKRKDLIVERFLNIYKL